MRGLRGGRNEDYRDANEYAINYSCEMKVVGDAWEGQLEWISPTRTGTKGARWEPVGR